MINQELEAQLRNFEENTRKRLLDSYEVLSKHYNIGDIMHNEELKSLVQAIKFIEEWLDVMKSKFMIFESERLIKK